jgi:hypothetical protein
MVRRSTTDAFRSSVAWTLLVERIAGERVVRTAGPEELVALRLADSLGRAVG